MLQFRCTCGKLLQAKEEHAGRQVVCPGCNTALLVPGTPAAIQPPVFPQPRPVPPPQGGWQENAHTAGRPASPRAPGGPPDYRHEERSRPRTAQQGPNGKALTSLILGCLTFIIPVLMAIPAIILGLLALRDVKRSQGRVGGKGLAIAGLITGTVGNLSLIPILWLWGDVSERQDRVESQQNLKQIGLAMHSYHDAYRSLPAGIVARQTGKPLLSWRVQILPFIEQDHLFRQFKLDEPWDGPNNSRLIAQMPQIYKPLRGSAPPNTTYYQVFTGPNTPFQDPRRPIRLIEFLDGTSNTMLVVEAGEPVIWTKPDDIVVQPNMPLPRLGGMWSNGFNCMMGDGSVRWVNTRRVSEQTLRLMIDPRDGMPLPVDELN